MDGEQVADEARNSIGNYCMTVCKALCCRKGLIYMRDKNEMQAVTGNKQNDLERTKILIAKDDGFVLDVGKQQCPQLTPDFKCAVYKNQNRPMACHHYPLYLYGEQVVAAPGCLAVQNKLLDPYLEKLEKLGYRII